MGFPCRTVFEFVRIAFYSGEGTFLKLVSEKGVVPKIHASDGTGYRISNKGRRSYHKEGSKHEDKTTYSNSFRPYFVGTRCADRTGHRLFLLRHRKKPTVSVPSLVNDQDRCFGMRYLHASLKMSRLTNARLFFGSSSNPSNNGGP